MGSTLDAREANACVNEPVPCGSELQRATGRSRVRDTSTSWPCSRPLQFQLTSWPLLLDHLLLCFSSSVLRVSRFSICICSRWPGRHARASPRLDVDTSYLASRGLIRHHGQVSQPWSASIARGVDRDTRRACLEAIAAPRFWR